MKQVLREKSQLHGENYGYCILMLNFEFFFFQAFGAPTIVAHINGEPQMFFGSDRFLLMAHMFGK